MRLLAHPPAAGVSVSIAFSYYTSYVNSNHHQPREEQVMASFKLRNCMRGAAATGLLAWAALSLQAQTTRTDSSEIAAIFSEIKTHAVLAEADAEVLNSYARSEVTWQTHAHRISEMKVHVNDLVRDYQKVNELRPTGSAWQQQTIDQMAPLIRGMADHLGAAIDHLNQNQSRVHMKPWQDYVRANRDYAVKTANLLRDVVEYGEAKDKANSLEQRLGLNESSGE